VIEKYLIDKFNHFI